MENKRYGIIFSNYIVGTWESQNLNLYCLVLKFKFMMVLLCCQIMNGFEEFGGLLNGFQLKNDIFIFLENFFGCKEQNVL